MSLIVTGHGAKAVGDEMCLAVISPNRQSSPLVTLALVIDHKNPISILPSMKFKP